MAIQELSRLAAYSDQVVPALVDMLQKDKDDHVRRVAAACLAGVGVRAKSAVPVLKQGLNDPDAYIRDACQRALDQIKNAKPQPEQEEGVKRQLAIWKEINEFKKAAGGSS
jgi:HEAT repeat protein